MSVFSAEKFVNWKKDRGFYSFDSIPKTVIIAAQEISFKKAKSYFSKKIKSISGKNYLYSDHILLSTSFGVGAPALIAVCEELRCLGVKNFYFIGVAGRLNAQLKESEMFEISKAISENGITKSYFNEEVILPTDNGITINGLKKEVCWSTDAPYRETSEKISFYKQLGANLVDMETAGLYSFAKYYNVNAKAFLVAADLCSEETWQGVKEYDEIENKLQFIVQQIIKTIEE